MEIQSFFIQAPDGHELAQQVPRSDNAAADAAANYALDHGSFMEVRLPETAAFVHELSCNERCNIGLLFSFDGAARGNPGPASYGVCAWWGLFSEKSFHSRGLILQRGSRIGVSTNNVAESYGQTQALRACLHYHCWITEQVTRLIRHTKDSFNSIQF